VSVALAGLTWAKLNQVVVGLGERDQPYQVMELLAATEVRWFEADGAHQQVDPFIRGELATTPSILFEIECCKLDWFHAVDPERTSLALLLFVVLMADVNLRPYPAHQQAVVISQEVFGNVDVSVAEVLQFGPMLVVIGNVAHLHLVDESVFSLVLD